ncbi:hypothetical protein DCO57_21995 [Labrenzia sp. 011]|nr:hypothetical protein DCO57_21995 [Labrenzia sp. 011]
MRAQQKLLLDYESAAEALSLTRSALRDLVYKGRGPATIKLGRRTMFAMSDLEAFIEANRIASGGLTPFFRTERSTDAAPKKRRRGRPTKIEQLAREAHFRSREGGEA